MQKITPFFWFENQAEEAANYYVSLFPNSKINNIVRYPKAAEAISGKKEGDVMTVDLEINGQAFNFLNGGKVDGYNLSDSGAVSFVVHCDSQEEIDRYWDALSAVKEKEQCGWCQDKFGVTWQIFPNVLGKYLSDADKEKVERVTKCFMNMKKLDIPELEKAFNG